MQKVELLTRNLYKLHQVSGTKLHLGADIFSTTISILPLRLQIKMAIVILTDLANFGVLNPAQLRLNTLLLLNAKRVLASGSRRNYDEPKFRYYFLIADEPGTERVSGLGFAKPAGESQQNAAANDRPD